MNICDRLKLLRENLGLTQPAAATKFSIPLSTWKQYEKGPSEPGSGALRGLHNGGVNINWLLTGEGDMLLSKPRYGLDAFDDSPRGPIGYGHSDEAYQQRLRDSQVEAAPLNGKPQDVSYTQGEQIPSSANPIDMDILEMCILFIERQNQQNRTSMTPQQKSQAVRMAYQVLIDENEKENEASFKHAQTILAKLVKSM